MKLSLIHPSRSRISQSKKTSYDWRWFADDKDFQLIVSCDHDDPQIEDYKTWYEGLIIINQNRSAVDAINNAAKVSAGDILIVVSDDSTCPKSWDKIIIDALEGKSGLLKTFDGVQKWICTMPIITRDYYESKGYIYHPDYLHMFCDSHLTHVAELEKKLIIRNDLVFPHNHYSTGKSKKDAVNTKADSTWAQGEKLYLDWCRDMSKKVDIFNLSKEARQAGHVNWLKKKLK